MAGTVSLDGALLNLIFTNANTGIGIGGTVGGLLQSTTAGSFYVSLHTADPGKTGTQTTSEATYTGYARQAVARSGAGWTYAVVSNDSWVSNAGTITYPICTGGSSNVTFFGIGTDLTGVGNLLFSGATTSFLNITNNITPSYAANNLLVHAN